MSTQKGNTSRSRPQKHKNSSVFKNSLHDTSHRTKFINSIAVSNVCQRCKEIIEWKIKYKKYKPLTQPKKCIKCDQKTIRHAYHVMCLDCGRKLEVCTKCGKSKEIVPAAPDKQEQIRLDSDLETLLQTLPERKRRTFIRYMNKMNKDGVNGEETKVQKDDLISKINSLKVSDNDEDDDDFDFSDSDLEDGSDFE